MAETPPITIEKKKILIFLSKPSVHCSIISESPLLHEIFQKETFHWNGQLTFHLVDQLTLVRSVYCPLKERSVLSDGHQTRITQENNPV